MRSIATGAVSIRARPSIVFPSRWLTSISSSKAALGTIRYNPLLIIPIRSRRESGPQGHRRQSLRVRRALLPVARGVVRCSVGVRAAGPDFLVLAPSPRLRLAFGDFAELLGGQGSGWRRRASKSASLSQARAALTTRSSGASANVDTLSGKPSETSMPRESNIRRAIPALAAFPPCTLPSASPSARPRKRPRSKLSGRCQRSHGSSSSPVPSRAPDVRPMRSRIA